MSNEHTLTPEQWAQIPPEYIWYAVDFDGEQWAYTHEPKKVPDDGAWVKLRGRAFKICDTAYRPVYNWGKSLQKRPTIAEQPATAPTPPVSNIRLPMAEFERIAADFGLTVRDCETYKDAAMYSPSGKVSIVFVADLPVTNIAVHDEVGGMPVTIHDQI